MKHSILVVVAMLFVFSFTVNAQDGSDLTYVKLNGKWGYVNKNGKEVIPLKYEGTSHFHEGTAVVSLNGKVGSILSTGKELIPFKDWKVNKSSNLMVKMEGDYYAGFFDLKKGTHLPPNPKHDGAEDFSEGLAAVKSIYQQADDIFDPGMNETKAKWGFIDRTGKEVVPLKYEFARSFSEGLAAVSLNGKFGVIDKSGNELSPFKYDYISEYKNGFAIIKLNEKYGFIDRTGNEITAIKYDDVRYFNENRARVKLNGEWGFISTTGNELIPLKYDRASNFSGGVAVVWKDRKAGSVDKYNNMTIRPFYDFIDIPSNGYAIANSRRQYRILNLKEKKEIRLNKAYTSVDDLSEGIAIVELNGKYGYIDTTGKEITDIKYEKANKFYNGMASVFVNGKWGYINKSGKEIIPVKYDSVSELYGYSEFE